MDTGLFYYKGTFYYIPDLWRMVSSSLKSGSQGKFKGIRNWFACQGYNQHIDLLSKDQLIEPIFTKGHNNIPKKYRRTYYVRNQKLNRKESSNYAKLFKELFIEAKKKYSELSSRSTIYIEENGKSKRLFLPSPSAKIKKELGLGRKQVLLALKYDEDLISAAYRLAYYEFQSRHTQAESKDIDKLFAQHKSRWVALRNPFKPENNFKFLVMIYAMNATLEKIFNKLFTIDEWSTSLSSVEDFIDVIRIKWPNSSLSKIDHIRKSVELSNCKLLRGCEFWSLFDALELDMFQKRIQQGRELPKTQTELLKEIGIGALNDFCIGLFGSQKFRQAINQHGGDLFFTGSKMDVSYIGSYTKGEDTEFPGQSTVFIPDATTKTRPEVERPEYLLIKNEAANNSGNAIIDLMKQQNSRENPYRTFQMNVYSNQEVKNTRMLTRKRRSDLHRLIMKNHANGIIIFSFPEYVIHGFPRFAEVFNAARLIYVKNHRQGTPIPKKSGILKGVYRRLRAFQPYTDWEALKKQVVTLMQLFNFEVDTEWKFVEEAFLNYIWKRFFTDSNKTKN
jgi:hypothetical protein